jgi:hypothetical protein
MSAIPNGFRKCLALAGLLIVSTVTTGCAWMESLRGEGFPEWKNTIGTGVRTPEPEAKPSGMFFSRKAEQIESSLGGNFD